VIGVCRASEYALEDAIETDVRVESAGVGSDSDAKDALCRKINNTSSTKKGTDAHRLGPSVFDRVTRLDITRSA
jgi:hypothetical protein